MHLIEEDEAPLAADDRVKDALAFLRALEGSGDHAVRAHHHAALPREPLLAGRREAPDILVLDRRPELELECPLVHRHSIRYEHLQPRKRAVCEHPPQLG